MKIRVQGQRFGAKKLVRLLELGFFLAGCITLGFCGWVYFEAWWYQAAEIGKFQTPAGFGSEARADLTVKLSRARPRVTEPALEQGTAFSKMEIPRLGLAVVVVEGVQPRFLKLGAGHVPGTALPGEPGNIAIAAHRDTFFHQLSHIQEHDRITLTTLRGAYNYSVESTEIVNPAAVEVLEPSNEQTLTLITCYPFGYLGNAPQRFVVKARQESQVEFPAR